MRTARKRSRGKIFRRLGEGFGMRRDIDGRISAAGRRPARAGGALAGVLLAAVALGPGCGLNTLTSGLGGGMFGGNKASTEIKSVSNDQLLTAAKADGNAAQQTGGIDVAHGCPRFQVWPQDNTLTVYEPGRAGDGLAVMHRGEITKTARECAVAGGQVTVKYGFAGRVLLGPRGAAGRVTLPVNVFVTDAKRARLANERMTVDVDVSPDNPIGYFSSVRTVTIPVPEGARPGEFDVFVGFEQKAPGAS
ncbi:MAG: hypothetical protein R3D27_05900 [Hyphomicrobiaceae bacterium]